MGIDAHFIYAVCVFRLDLTLLAPALAWQQAISLVLEDDLSALQQAAVHPRYVLTTSGPGVLYDMMDNPLQTSQSIELSQ